MRRERYVNIPLAKRPVLWQTLRRSCGRYPAGRSVIWSGNDGGASELATVGCGQAEGSPKGEAPAAGAAQLRKQSPTSPPRRQVRVHSDGLAPKVRAVVKDGTAPSWFRPLGSGPMSFALGLHQRSVGRDRAAARLALAVPSQARKTRTARQFQRSAGPRKNLATVRTGAAA